MKNKDIFFQWLEFNNLLDTYEAMLDYYVGSQKDRISVGLYISTLKRMFSEQEKDFIRKLRRDKIEQIKNKE